MHSRAYAELAHDDMVELFFKLGVDFSEAREENLAVFRELFAIVARRMAQLEGVVRDDLCYECAGMLLDERERLHQRLVPARN